MKILYVGDGRSRINWGARATSKALHDLLAKNNSITGIVDSMAKDAPSISSPYIKAISNRKKVFPFSVLYPAANKMWPSDYITGRN